MGCSPATAQAEGVETTTPPPSPPIPPSAPVPPPPRHRRLRRDRSHRVLGGVAAGIAETYGLDVLLVRVLWIIAAIAWIGIPAYVVAWIAIPAGDGEGHDVDTPRDFGMLIALALIGIGVLVAVDQVLPGAWHAGRVSGPLLLIGAGVAILVLRRPRDNDGESDGDGDGDGGDTEASIEADSGTTARTVANAAVADGLPTSAWTQTEEWPTTPPPSFRQLRRTKRRTRPRPFLTPIALSLLLIGGGVASLLQSTDTVDVNLTIAFAIATCFVGAVLVLSTWIGRAHGLIAVGVLLAFATAAASTIDVPLHGGFGDRSYQPKTAAALLPTYELSAGTIHLDLRQLRAVSDQNVAVTVGFGEINVDVPSTMTVDVVAKAGAGNIELFGHQSDGWHVKDERTAVGSGTAIVHLDLHVGAGHIIVRRWDTGNETILGDNG